MYVIIHILFHIICRSFQNLIQSTQNHFNTIRIISNQLEITQNLPRISPNQPRTCQTSQIYNLSNPRHCHGSECLGNLLIYQTYQFDLSTIMSLSARSNFHSHHPIIDIDESLNVRLCYYDPPYQLISIM